MNRVGGGEALRARQAERTRQLLLSIARKLFTERGYAGTSVEDIIQRAGVARGTLYHHFTGKDVLFGAVYDAVQADAASRLASAARAVPEPWGAVRAGLSACLDACLDPAFRRIVLLDSVVVLQHDVREAGVEHAESVLRGVLTPVVNTEFPGLAVDALVQVTLGALNSVAFSIARSPDPIRARLDADAVIDALIRRLRSHRPEPLAPNRGSSRTS